MSKRIDLGKPLSPEDREYLMNRGRAAEVADNEGRFGRTSGMTMEQRADRIAELEGELAGLRAEQEREANPNLASPTSIASGGVKDNTVVDGETPAGAPVSPEDNYEKHPVWTVSKLVDELKERNRDRAEAKQPPLSLTGTKAELIERLREDDKELVEQ
jgi:hypothetical protein